MVEQATQEAVMPRTIEGVVLFTIDEIAQKLNLSPRTIADYVHRGRLKVTRIGKTPYISHEFLMEFLTTPEPREPREEQQ